MAIARALKGTNAAGHTGEDVGSPDRLFLLGRIGFLVTLDRPKAVADMVDKEDLMASLVLVSHYTSSRTITLMVLAIEQPPTFSNELHGTWRAVEAGRQCTPLLPLRHNQF